MRPLKVLGMTLCKALLVVYVNFVLKQGDEQELLYSIDSVSAYVTLLNPEAGCVLQLLCLRSHHDPKYTKSR
jgi:hypothetical protein